MANLIAQNVRRLMREKKISGRKLAALAGHNPMTINHLINSRHMPGADLLFDVADALGVSTDDLRARREPKQKKSA